MSVAEEIHKLKETLPEGVSLVAVSKYHPSEAIREAYAAGQRIFGESHVQELQRKVEELEYPDIEWHFIGHLQTNKVKYIAPYISLIHAVDSEKLLREIDKQGTRCQRVIRCLLQLHVAQEETKFGFSVEECREFLQSGVWREMKHVAICGIMCMASNTEDEEQIHSEFRKAHDFFLEAKNTYFAGQDEFAVCSWGMSDDYPIAIEEGSTLIRVGSRIFGARSY